MTRREERELVLKVLFAQEFNAIPFKEQLEYLLQDAEEKKRISPFVEKMIQLYLEHKAELDERIRPKLINWDFNRVATIDRILLRMALVEFLYFADIPPEVTIDEMIEIGKQYSTPKTGKFINGLLDALLKDLKKKKMIKKSGRGLISKIDLEN